MLAKLPLFMVLRSAVPRTGVVCQPCCNIILGRSHPYIKLALPLGWPGLTHTHLFCVLTVVAIIDVTPVPDDGPHKAPQVDHVKEHVKITTIWLPHFTCND